MRFHGFFIAVIISFTVLGEIRPDQPGCDVNSDQFEFYKEFYRDGAEEFPTNFVCKASFKTKIHMCITVLRNHLMKGIETYYTMTEDAENVSKSCEKREVSFWWVNRTETRTVEFFKCPITKIRHEIISGFFVPKQTDFYITKGWTKAPGKTIFMLRQSNTTDNLCVLGEYFWMGE